MRWLRDLFRPGPDMVFDGERLVMHRAPKGFTLMMTHHNRGGASVAEVMGWGRRTADVAAEEEWFNRAQSQRRDGEDA